VCQTSIKRVNDVGAALEVPHMAPPERAVPTWQQSTYSIRDTMYQGKPAVAIYHGVVPKHDLSSLTREDSRYFVVANPIDGLYSFPISSRALAAGVAGLPADTGRNGGAARTASAPLKVTAATSSALSHLNVVTWEERNAKRETVHEDVLRANPLNKTIKESIKAAGWNAEEHVGLLVPLAIKLYNPDIRRN
jgi:hypothetical protein